MQKAHRLAPGASPGKTAVAAAMQAYLEELVGGERAEV